MMDKPFWQIPIFIQGPTNFLNDPPTIDGIGLKGWLQAKAAENAGVLIHIQ